MRSMLRRRAVLDAFVVPIVRTAAPPRESLCRQIVDGQGATPIARMPQSPRKHVCVRIFCEAALKCPHHLTRWMIRLGTPVSPVIPAKAGIQLDPVILIQTGRAGGLAGQLDPGFRRWTEFAA
jgi:hypothetical protein